MRLFVLNFLLLATIAITSSEERHKRHFPILKWIKSALFGPEDTIIEEVAVSPTRPEYEVFRLPGHDDVVVKVSPKILNAGGVLYREVEPVNLRAFGSVVGIESPDDTIAAVREVDNLLSSGILYGGYDDVMKDHIVAMFPGVRTVDEEIVPVIDSRPIISEVITPLEGEIEIEVPLDQDSHEQATIITADTKPGTELVETIKKDELPNCIRRRIGAAVLLGADPYRYERVEEVYPAAMVEISYPRPGDSLIQNQFHEKILKVTDVELPAPLLLSQKHADSSKPIHLEEVHVSVSKKDGQSGDEKLTAFTNTGKEVDLAQTLGPIPSWYLERMNLTETVKTNDQQKPVIIIPTKENVVSKRVENSDLPANTIKLLKSKVVDPHPLFIHHLHPVHLEDVRVSDAKDNGKSENEELSPYTSKKDLSRTLELISYPHLKHIEATDNWKTNDQVNPVVIVPSKEKSLPQYVKNVVLASEDSKIEKERDQENQIVHSNSKEEEPSLLVEIAKVSAKSKTVPKKEHNEVKLVQTATNKPKADIVDGNGHGYVYVNHPNPTKVKLVKENDILKTNVKTNSNNNLKVVTPAKLEPAKPDTAQSKHIDQSEKVREVKRVVKPIVSITNPLKTNKVKPLAQIPVLALNNKRSKEGAHQKHFKMTEPHAKTYSYQQKQADGSSLNVEAEKNVISVDFKGRGDIPEK